MTDAKETDSRCRQTTAGHQPFSASDRAHKLSAAFTIHPATAAIQLLFFSEISRRADLFGHQVILHTVHCNRTSSRHVVAVVLRSPGCSVPTRCIPHAPRRLDEGGTHTSIIFDATSSTQTADIPLHLPEVPTLRDSLPTTRPQLGACRRRRQQPVTLLTFCPRAMDSSFDSTEQETSTLFSFRAPASGEFYTSTSSLCIRVLGLRTGTVLLSHQRRRVSRLTTTTLIEAWPLRPRPRILSCRRRESSPAILTKSERRKHQLKQTPFYARYERDNSRTSSPPPHRTTARRRPPIQDLTTPSFLGAAKD